MVAEAGLFPAQLCPWEDDPSEPLHALRSATAIVGCEPLSENENNLGWGSSLWLEAMPSEGHSYEAPAPQYSGQLAWVFGAEEGSLWRTMASTIVHL